VIADVKRSFQGLTKETCHELCQNTADCQMFKFVSTSASETCHLIKNGACTKTVAGGVTDTKIYAKTGFYEEPNLTADKCTHFSKWNHNAERAAYCKEYTTE
jgi:hypothetical protein